MPEPTYYIAGLFRQANDTLARSYLKISTGAGGVQAISAGVNSTSSGTVVFSNANNVSFGMNGAGVVTAIANTVGGGAITNILFSAGTYSTYRSDITFDNSNGVTFGQDTAGVITATVRTDYQSSGAYLTTAALSQDSSKYAGTGFTTATTAGTNIVGTLNTAGLSMGIPGYLTTATGGITAINLSAGTTSSNISAFTFSNGSGVTFGFDGSNVTASVQTNYLTTAMASDRGTDFVQATAGFHGTNASGTIASSGISVSVAPPTAANINISAGTTSSNVTAVTFSNANNVSFGYDGSNVTASVTVASTQDSMKISAGTLSANRSDLTFADSNGISFGLNTNGVITGTVATNYLTTAQPVGNYAGTATSVVTTSGTDLSFALNTNGETIAYPKWITTAMASNAVTLSNIKVSAGSLSANRSDITFADSNGISFGLDTNGVITGTVATNYQSAGAYLTTAMQSNAVTLSNINISAGASSSNVSAVTFNNSNGVTFGYDGTNITASVATAYVTSPPVTLSFFDNHDAYVNVNSATHQSNTFLVFPMTLPCHLSASFLRLQVSGSFTTTTVATSAVNNTTGASTGFNYAVAANAVIYSMGTSNNSASLQYVTSNSVGFTWSVTISLQSTSNGSRQTVGLTFWYPVEQGTATSSNTTAYNASSSNILISTVAANQSDLTGCRYLDIPFPRLFTPGNYWVALNGMSSSTGGKSNQFTVATWGRSFLGQAFGLFNVAANLTNRYMPLGWGSWTTNVAQTTSSINIAQISGSNDAGAGVIPFLRFIRQA